MNEYIETSSNISNITFGDLMMCIFQKYRTEIYDTTILLYSFVKEKGHPDLSFLKKKKLFFPFSFIRRSSIYIIWFILCRDCVY